MKKGISFGHEHKEKNLRLSKPW